MTSEKVEQKEDLDENSNKKETKIEIVWKNVAIFILLHYWAGQVFWNWKWIHFWFRK